MGTFRTVGEVGSSNFRSKEMVHGGFMMTRKFNVKIFLFFISWIDLIEL